MTPTRLFDEIANASPGFRSILLEHQADNSEVLSHVLMAELVRYIEARLADASSQVSNPTEVQAVFDILDLAITEGSMETRDAIAGSFVADLECLACFGRLKPLLGIALRRELKRQAGSQARP